MYNTRQRNFDTEFYEQQAADLANDIERKRGAGEVEEIHPFADDNNDNDIDHVPNEDDGPDFENEVVIEPSKMFDSDDDEEEIHSETLLQSATEDCCIGHVNIFQKKKY